MFRLLSGFFRPYNATDAEYEAMQRTVAKGNLADGGYSESLSRSLNAASSQSATYLTHVSIMIAVSGFLLGAADEASLYRQLLLVELCGYLLLALVAIRCQYRINHISAKRSTTESEIQDTSIPKFTVNSGKFERSRTEELVFRDYLLRSLFWSVYLLTFVLIGTLVFGTSLKASPPLHVFTFICEQTE